jgi:hypothetical protein
MLKKDISPFNVAMFAQPIEEAEPNDKKPIRGTFFACCASAITPRTSNTTTTRIETAAFFIARTSFRALFITPIEIKESLIYTANGDRDSSSRKPDFS